MRRILLLAFATLCLTSCVSEGPLASGANAKCATVEYRVDSTEYCTIECSWAQGYGGYAVSTPIDCKNYGSPVTRIVR